MNSPLDKGGLGGISRLKGELKQHSSPAKAKQLKRFFKTGKGQYGEGDKFIGVIVPNIRTVAKQYSSLPFPQLKQLLTSSIHEHRLCALLILVTNFQLAVKQANQVRQKQIFNFYLRHTKYINNWDLVDLSAPKIIGAYLFCNKKLARPLLKKLSYSTSLWRQRIAILATFYFIKNNEYSHSLRLSKQFLTHKHDLIHKASGWMLREIGKSDQAILEKFLQQHYKKMPRTMLRYSIERLPQPKRQAYLKKN